MQLASLSTLVAILESGSFMSAADTVGRTPSAVSVQIKQLEAWFGRPLFDRSARRVVPTPFALEVGATARNLIAQLEALRSSRPAEVTGRLRLGAIASVQAQALPEALRSLRDRHPGLVIDLSLGDSDELLRALRGDRLDAAICIRPAGGGSRRLRWHDLARQPFTMIAPPDAPALPPAGLLERYGWIRYDAALTGGRIAARHVLHLKPKARAAFELRSVDAIVAMVASGLGVSIVPRPREELVRAYGVREIPLGATSPSRQISLVQRAADAEDRRIEAVRQAFAMAFAGRPLRQGRV